MLESIENIIVPTDFSELSEIAVQSAARLARGQQATIHLLHVVRLPFLHTTYDINVPQSVWDGLRDEMRVQMDETCERLAAAGVTRVERLISEAPQPAEFIEQKVRALDADLVVMATHGRKGLAHAFLGSIAEATLRTCPAPVLAIKGEGIIGDKAIQRILVPIDFSIHFERVRDLAVSLAKRFDASIDLLHVLDEAPIHARRYAVELADLEAQARATSSERLAAAVDKIEEAGLQVRTHLYKGHPPEVIAKQAAQDESDLIVMGTHGYRGFTRIALGSVAERTLRLAPCSVLTTRAEAEDGGASS
ncbi:MAG: universal stress protein [Deltaproteobacteria bacterium]|nr:universal stress protein [Deltaproteobacteria bacterium]